MNCHFAGPDLTFFFFPSPPPIRATVQVAYAFAFLAPEPVEEESSSSNSQQSLPKQLRSRIRVERRLRVYSFKCPLVNTSREIYQSAQVLPILSLVSHKICRVSFEEGLQESKSMLRDWLLILLKHYNQNTGAPHFLKLRWGRVSLAC